MEGERDREMGVAILCNGTEGAMLPFAPHNLSRGAASRLDPPFFYGLYIYRATRSHGMRQCTPWRGIGTDYNTPG